ncbi:MAG TPA: DUF4386 family protein [Solirubrobacteraceae bacterium]|jgi:hypothetical protein
MTPEEQLAFESRQRPRQIVFAAAGGALLMIASIIGLLGPHSPVSELTLNLITEHHRAGYDIFATILNAVAEVSFGITLWYLWRCTRSRATKSLSYLPVLIGIGVVIAAVTGVVYVLAFAHIASEFVTTGAQTYDQANHLESSGVIEICKVLGQLGALLIAVSFVLVSLQAMRVGLLPKFMGYVGMLAGALFLFPITQIPIVQLFWLLALAMLFAGRWPDGVPAAWKTGQAEAWPSSAEMRARRMADSEVARDRRAARKRGDHRKAVSDAPTPQQAANADAAAPAPSNANRKRKRKRRR